MGSIKHAKTSPVPNPLGDTRRVGGGDWNSEHVIDLDVSDIDGLEARLIPVEQVEQFRDDALQFRNEAAASASDAADSAAEAATTIGALAAPGGAELVGTPEGTVQEALDGRVKQDALSMPATVPAYAFSALEAQSIFDNALPMQSYTALRAYTGRAAGVRITSTGLAGFFYRDDSDTTSADNGGTIIVDAAARRWKRLYDGTVNVMWFGALGNGATDDSAAIQATIDLFKGGTILIPAGGRFVHAGILLAGSTYGGTRLVCEGELVLKVRPTGATNNYQGGWIGLILEDVDRVSVVYRGDGQRTLQPAEEHCHLVAIAGGNTIHFPSFSGREVRGDGIYIGQLDFQNASAIPTDLVFDNFTVINSADDGRNAMSIISAKNVHIGNFTSIRVGGLIGAVTQPGGFDIEPNQDFQTVENVSIGSAFIDTAGNFGFQITGRLRNTLGGNVKGFSFGFAHVITRCTLTSAAPVIFLHASDVVGRCLVEFKSAVQLQHVGVTLDNLLSSTLEVKSVGGAYSARIGYAYDVVGLTLDLTARNYSAAGCQTVSVSQSRINVRASGGTTAGARGLYTRAVTRPGLTQTDVDYSIYCPKATTAGTTGCYNEVSDLVAFSGVRFTEGSLVGYATATATMNGFGVGVLKLDVPGVNFSNAAPTDGTWDVSNKVWNIPASAGGIPGWVCVTAGAPGTWKAMANLAA